VRAGVADCGQRVDATRWEVGGAGEGGRGDCGQSLVAVRAGVADCGQRVDAVRAGVADCGQSLVAVTGAGDCGQSLPPGGGQHGLR